MLAWLQAAGMVVHPSPGHYSGTLVNALLHHLHLPCVEVSCGNPPTGLHPPESGHYFHISPESPPVSAGPKEGGYSRLLQTLPASPWVPKIGFETCRTLGWGRAISGYSNGLAIFRGQWRQACYQTWHCSSPRQRHDRCVNDPCLKRC